MNSTPGIVKRKKFDGKSAWTIEVSLPQEEIPGQKIKTLRPETEGERRRSKRGYRADETRLDGQVRPLAATGATGGSLAPILDRHTTRLTDGQADGSIPIPWSVKMGNLG